MFVKSTHTVDELEGSIRLYDYAHQIFKNYIPSKKGIKKSLKRGEIRVDNKIGKSGDWVRKGQVIELRDLELTPPKPFPLDLEIVFEDDYLAVINKPAGISVSGNQHRTIQNAIIGQLKESTMTDKLKWPRPVHRLDNQTSGLLVIAKTASSIISLSKQFEKRKVKKIYHALVVGVPEKKEVINLPIDTQNAITRYETLKTVNSVKSGKVSFLKLEPETGRTHQLRIHCAKSGFPILGDKLYGEKGNILLHKGLFLCATDITLTHPKIMKQMSFKISTPYKFQKQLDKEKGMYEKLNSE